MPATFIVLLHGPMGSGKTTTSKLLHEQFVPSARVALPDLRRLVSGNHREHADITRDIMLEMTDVYLVKGVPVIVEVVCQAPYIAKYKELAAKHDCVFLPYYISADEALRFDRVCERTRQMLDVAILPESKKEELQTIFTENATFYACLEGELGTSLDTTNLTPEQVVSEIKTTV